MRQWRLLILGIGVLTAAICTCLSARAEGWVLSQYTPYGGPHTLSFSSQGMRLEQKKMGITIVAKAPDWTITMFNDRARTYFQVPYHEFVSRKGGARSGFGYDNSPPQRVQTGTVGGLNATLYRTGKAGKSRSISYWLSNDISVPHQLTDIIGKQFHWPITVGVPLKVEKIDELSRAVTELNTESGRLDNLTIASFTYPKTYKRVSSDVEVLVPPESSQTTADLLNEFSSDPATKKELDQLLKSSGSKSGAYGGSTYPAARPAAGPGYAQRPASTPPASRTVQSKKSSDIDALIDSFLKTK